MMRLLVRSQTRVPFVPARRAAGHRAVGEERRAWIEALFGDYLPRNPAQRERAIEVLVGDGSVWRMLHQVRHSMAETSATIERLARAALEQRAA